MKWILKEIRAEEEWGQDMIITMSLECISPFGVGFGQPLTHKLYAEIEDKINKALNFDIAGQVTNLDCFRNMTADELATILQGFCPDNCFTYCTMCESEQDCVECRKRYFEKEVE